MNGTPRRILIIKLSALGDFIIALPAMRAIRAHHPDAHITLMTTRAFESMAWACDIFDAVWIDTRPKKLDWRGWIKLRSAFANGAFDRVYDLQNNTRTALYFHLSQTLRKKPSWAGTMRGAAWRDTHSSKKTDPAARRHAQLLAMAGITATQTDDLRWMGGSHDDLQRIFQIPEPYILVVPGCAPSRPEKRWPADRYGDLCSRLCTRRYNGQPPTPVIIGTRDETPLADVIRAHCPQAIDLTGQTAITDLPLLGRHAVAAIGNDTGPIHMIAPTGCPTFVLFGPTSDPALHAPHYPWVRTLQSNGLDALDVDDVDRFFKI